MRINLDRVVQVSTTQLEEGLIMLTSVFIEKGKTTCTSLKLTCILQIKLSHVSESYISQLYYVTQVHQDMKAFLFKFIGGLNSFENKLQNVKSVNVKENLIIWTK